jgi:hypothetical protein
MSFCSKDIDYQRVSTFFWIMDYEHLQIMNGKFIIGNNTNNEREKLPCYVVYISAARICIQTPSDNFTLKIIIEVTKTF